MVGAFPPPVHGMASINAAMFERLKQCGIEPLKLDLAPATLDRGWLNRIRRTKKVVKALRRFAGEMASGQGRTLYVGLSGGWGQIYESLFVVFAKLRGARIFLHHHSFAYLDQPSLPASVLINLAGRSATHVVLCEVQGRRLRERYAVVSDVRNVSNAAIMDRVAPVLNVRTRLRRVGFLGNISREKGIDDVISIAERLVSAGIGVDLQVAGPFENSSIEHDFRRALARFPLLKYSGPVYRSEKDAFFDSVDVMLFPSTYVNETAPLVVYEAMSHGIPVIAKRRGCLVEMIPEGSGVCVCPNEDYSARALECLAGWQRDPAGLAQASRAAAAAFDQQVKKSAGNLGDLLRDLCNNTYPGLSPAPCQ